MATAARRAKEVFPSSGVGYPSPLYAEKRQEICKLPRFTKSAEEPTLFTSPAYGVAKAPVCSLFSEEYPGVCWAEKLTFPDRDFSEYAWGLADDTP
jgi:hypothetical protein